MRILPRFQVPQVSQAFWFGVEKVPPAALVVELATQGITLQTDEELRGLALENVQHVSIVQNPEWLTRLTNQIHLLSCTLNCNFHIYSYPELSVALLHYMFSVALEWQAHSDIEVCWLCPDCRKTNGKLISSETNPITRWLPVGIIYQR